MKSKFLKVFCTAALSLLVCTGSSVSGMMDPDARLTYNQVIAGMGSIVRKAFDANGRLTTEDYFLISQAIWAETVLRIIPHPYMLQAGGEEKVEWPDMDQIFDASCRVTMFEHPNLAGYFRTPDVKKAIAEKMGLVKTF